MKYLLLLLALSLQAQTKLDIAQIKAAAGPSVRLLAVDTKGEPTVVTLGPGLTISSGVITATAVVPITGVTLLPTRLTVASDGSYVVVPGASVFTLNGQLLEEGPDYTITAGRLIPAKPWPPEWAVVQRVIRLMNPVTF